ncbi:MAG: lipopolysaccharide biosynthesis protein [Dehalococcoidia bacterium]
MRRIGQQIREPLYRNSIFLMANTIVTAGLGFFFWMVVARFYTEAEVGWGAAIISTASVLALLSRLGLGIALVRFLPKAEKPVDMINTCFTLGGIVAVALAAIFVAGLDLWSPALGFIKDNAIFSLAFISFVLLFTLSTLMESIFIARRRAEFALSKNTIHSLLKIPLPILLVLYFHAFGIVGSWGIGISVAFVISLFFFVPRVQSGYKPVPKLDIGMIKNTWRYSAGNHLAALFLAAPGLVLPLLIVNLLGAEQNAYFYIAWMIANLLFVIPLAVSHSLFAEGSHFEEELGVNVRSSLRLIFVLLIPAIIIIFLAGKWLLLLFGEGYSANGLMLLWILSISSIPLSIDLVYSTILRVEGRTSELVIIRGFRTLAVLLGSYLVVPATGIVGIGYVWIAAQGLASVYVAFAMRSRYHKRQA